MDFTITAPESHVAEIAYKNKLRQTHGVLIDIVLAAKSYIILSAPYLKDLAAVNPTLNGALIGALNMGVVLHIFSNEKSIRDANIQQYLQYNVHLYSPKATEKEDMLRSHAKFFLSDGKQVYLGSANFTVAGLNYNLEMGVYSKGELAKQVETFWFYLLDQGFLIENELNSLK